MTARTDAAYRQICGSSQGPNEENPSNDRPDHASMLICPAPTIVIEQDECRGGEGGMVWLVVAATRRPLAHPEFLMVESE